MSADQQETLDSFSEPPRRDGIYWGGDQRHVDELEVVGQIGQVGRVEVPDNALAWVLSGFDEYVDVRDVERKSIPSTYSSWEDEMDNLVAIAKVGEKVYAVQSERLKAAMKSLTGGGRYDESEYEWIATAPYPILRGPEGAVAIAPVELR